jgi:hypothetical protein
MLLDEGVMSNAMVDKGSSPRLSLLKGSCVGEVGAGGEGENTSGDGDRIDASVVSISRRTGSMGGSEGSE